MLVETSLTKLFSSVGAKQISDNQLFKNTCRSYGAENKYVILLHTYRSYGAHFQTIFFMHLTRECSSYQIKCCRQRHKL
jgi:sialic acid synthase SpsE